MKERLSVYLPPDLATRTKEIARQRGISMNDAVRIALGYLDIAEQERAAGRFVGSAARREALDTVIVALG